ncbi:MAG: T9SS type A sorting domain-containing protein [Candidatus Coatesbacteria bacterium]|nr:MAG: T9SS type A sorting domain-containing protein [Candidatus Coatesbacteria bacterium]
MKKIIGIALAAALASQVFGFSYSGRCHSQGQMPWTFNYNSRGTPDCANEFAQLTTALATWSNVSGQWYRQVRGANTSQLNYGYDSSVLAVWYHSSYRSYGQNPWRWGSGAIAVNVYWYSGSLIVHNDVCFNNYNFSWSDSGASGRMDVQNIAAHEFGHNLCLNDLYNSGARDYTMYGYCSYGETKKRTLHADDIAGIRYIYPNTGVRLNEFKASPNGGDVVVTWEAAVEINHAGYNLYRREDVGLGAEYVKLNEALIIGNSPYTFKDENVVGGVAYEYLLEAVDLNSHKERFGPVRISMPGLKATFALAPSYPNPARTEAVITFTLPEAGPARLTVYDVSGRRVATLAEGALEAGEREVVWNLTDDRGASVPPGVYFYRLETPTETAARRLVVAR